MAFCPTESDSEKLWLTVYDVADTLEVSDWTVRRMLDSGELPTKKIGKKRLIKIDRSEFVRWLERQ